MSANLNAGVAPGRQPDLVIDVRNLTRTYQLGSQEVHALRGVSLAIERGEFVAIMGASGSGKSTLMNLIGCLDQTSGGTYLLEGVDIAALDEQALAKIRSRRIGFVFQSFNLLPRTTAAENVALPLFYSGLLADGAHRVRETLALLGLGERLDNRPNQLSGGQQQRVALARALINQPAILLADEPTGNLDSTTANEIMNTLRDLNREQGLTVILVTHEQEMADFADRIITLRDGLVLSDIRKNDAPTLVKGTTQPLPTEAASSGLSLAELFSFLSMAFIAAFSAIGRNKLRSALTMLGIFIGVCALIIMLAVGEGARAAVQEQLKSLGTDLLIVLPGSSRGGGVRGGSGSASSLKVADGAAILEEDPAVAVISYVNRQSAQVENGDENWSTSVQGVTPSYLAIRNWGLSAGRLISETDEREGRTVCILGQTVVDNLFGEGQNPIGATVIVKNVPMEVIGVLAVKGHSASGQDQDDVALIPFRTSQVRVLGVAQPSVAMTQGGTVYPAPPNPFNIQAKLQGFVQTMYIQARGADQVKAALEQVTQTLERRHRIKPDQSDDFSVRDLTEIAEVADENSRVMELLLAAIASISLLVGGIGIMNILLVSVTERTREIGIRMAIGARRFHVLLQFLIEATLLSLIGGGAGVLAGIVASKVIAHVAGWPTLLHTSIIIGAFCFSAGIGMFFGFYPARKASLLNPIDALRYE
ncbi:Macrolide export ATP-binding/permease protein MacB [Collimonas arenae]|uniref:Macrolide export ATP-binding/permease protein MacB n=1 Tax=Collimonas arenae TaxID=279058 RepID=A0A0A1FB89_9BURK|nr:ABC transporter permease [Collimonas arenae]AIY41756.1 Macrolide export ATP-binding/permease protein MacB [Collimonas arenae]